MRLSKRTEYGLRAVVHLARLEPKQFVQAKDLARQEALPNKFLEAILLALRRGGFLESKVGSGGGYRLSRVPDEINVGDLLRRLEGRLTVEDPVEQGASANASAGEVACHLLNAKLTEATNAAMDALSLKELLDAVARADPATQGMYYI